MDKRIIWFAVIVVLIGGGLFALRFFSGRSSNILGPISFSVTPQTIFVGDSVRFNDETSGARTWNWNFGDPGGVTDIRQSGFYRFLNRGRYTLRLTINGQKTDSSITVTVNDPTGPVLGTKVRISGPEVAYVGKEYTFTDETPNAKHTVWQNSQTYDTKRDTRNYTVVFTHKGKVDIIASNELNSGPDGQGIKRVRVVDYPDESGPKPPPKHDSGDKPKPPPPPPPKSVSDEDLTTYFKTLSSRPESFRNEYALIKKATGGDESVPVTIVRSSDGTVIAQKPGLFGGCQHLNMMQLPVSKVTSERDPGDNSIKSITVSVNQ